jgi:hypothetical protein
MKMATAWRAAPLHEERGAHSTRAMAPGESVRSCAEQRPPPAVPPSLLRELAERYFPPHAAHGYAARSRGGTAGGRMIARADEQHSPRPASAPSAGQAGGSRDRREEESSGGVLFTRKVASVSGAKRTSRVVRKAAEMAEDAPRPPLILYRHQDLGPSPLSRPESPEEEGWYVAGSHATR